ncbi:late embryogenesis abundant protein 1-like [Ambystoma mexicanum]|uniref:late embryogenesis abundant protein 1-like n=1 Tax=Ambystoma mexicanum TaxID=8296 RepID=UPI0037E9818C
MARRGELLQMCAETITRLKENDTAKGGSTEGLEPIVVNEWVGRQILLKLDGKVAGEMGGSNKEAVGCKDIDKVREWAGITEKVERWEREEKEENEKARKQKQNAEAQEEWEAQRQGELEDMARRRVEEERQRQVQLKKENRKLLEERLLRE